MTQQTQYAKKSSVKPSAEKLQPGQDFASEERRKLVEKTAYLIAEQRGFQGEHALSDWLQAEAEVNAKCSAMH